MKIIKTNRNIALEFFTDSGLTIKMEMPSDNQFVMSDGVVDQTQKLYGKNSIEIINDFKDLPNKYNNHDLNNKKLLVLREGGAGDILFTTPTIKYLKEKYPSCSIGFSCSPVYHSLFNNHPHVTQIYSHIVAYSEFTNYDYFAIFEGVIEGNEEAKTVNSYDLFTKNFGIPLEEVMDKNPVMKISDEIKEYWKFVLKDSINTDKKIGYQLRASSPIRTVPLEANAYIIQGLINLGYTVFLIDSVAKKNEVNYFIHKFGFNENEKVVDTSKYSDNFERMAGLISLMDMYVGPDSSGTHLAAASNIPIVGMYSAFRSDVRLKYYKNAVGIDVLIDRCGLGCFANGYAPCPIASELGFSFAACWKLLNLDKVVEIVNEHYENTCSLPARKEAELRKMLLNFRKGE